MWTMGGRRAALRLRLPGWASCSRCWARTGGLRFVLADSEWYRDPAEPGGAHAGADGGRVRRCLLAVTPLVHVALELGSEWSRAAGRPRTRYEPAAARGRAAHVAPGVLFEY